MRKSFFIVISVILAVLISGLGMADAASEFEQKSERLVAKLHAYFPRVKGTVVSVRADKVFIDIGIQQNISIGAQLALLQEGVEIVHPANGKVLGTYEKHFGTIQVTEVMDQFSVARIFWQEPDTEILQGTVVGGFPGKVKVALLPLVNHTEAGVQEASAYTLFLRALRSDERFTVFDEADITAAALKAGISSNTGNQKDVLPELNSFLHAHNFLQMSLQPDADNILTQVTLLSPNGQEIGSVQEVLREYAVLQHAAPISPSAVQEPLIREKISQAPVVTSPGVLEESPQTSSSPQQRQDTFWTSDILRLKVHKVAVGDLTGNGKKEMVVATQTDLEIYEHGILGEKDSFFLLGKIEGYNDALILALGVGDINQNGREEIFITSLRTVSAEVRVFEYSDGKFKEIWDTKGIAMRIIHTPAGKTRLVGQKTTSSTSIEFLSGKISEYTWNGQDYSHSKRLDVPARVNIFGFTLANIDKDGRDEVLFYDRYNRINLFRNGGRIWRSGNYEPYKMNVLRKGEDEKTARRIAGRIELSYLGIDNDIRLVLFHNLRPFKVVTGLPMYNGSTFYVFRWDDEKFVKEFQSEELESYIVDYAVADVDNDGKQEVALAMVLKGDNFFKTPQSQILIYELESN